MIKLDQCLIWPGHIRNNVFGLFHGYGKAFRGRHRPPKWPKIAKNGPFAVLSHPGGRVILIQKILFYQLLHGFKLFHFVPRFQNSFCFCSTTIPSAVRKVFLKLHILYSKNEPKICKIDKMAKNHFSRSDLGS